MGRKQNNVPTETLTLSTTPLVQKYLQAIVETGFYGKNPAEAAERILAMALEAQVDSGKLERISK